MNKEQLRDDYLAQGYNIVTLDKWLKVSEINNVSKYDVSYEKDGNFQTAQVKVVDDGKADEEASILNIQVEAEPDFSARLEDFIRSKEVAPVYAIARQEVVEADLFATVNVYVEANDTVTKKTYAVRERAGTFTFKEIV